MHRYKNVREVNTNSCKNVFDSIPCLHFLVFAGLNEVKIKDLHVDKGAPLLSQIILSTSLTHDKLGAVFGNTGRNCALGSRREPWGSSYDFQQISEGPRPGQSLEMAG